MDAQQFLGIEPTADPLVWRLPVTLAVSTPGRFLFGGCGLAAGIVALEAASGRPTVWATAQYLSFAPTGSMLEWTVEPAASGRHITQARAVGRCDGVEVLTVNAALGHPAATELGDASWVDAPEVDPPLECPLLQRPAFMNDSVFERVEQRQAAGRSPDTLDGTPGDPRSAWWFHIPGHLEPSAATLAILGDYVTGGVSQPLGVQTMSRSLDNTLRVANLVPTEWLLGDIHIQHVSGGFAFGSAHLFAENGQLLGTASQSMSIRSWDPARLEAMRTGRGAG